MTQDSRYPLFPEFRQPLSVCQFHIIAFIVVPTLSSLPRSSFKLPTKPTLDMKLKKAEKKCTREIQ